ncbi:MAG TPA: class I SAM-dependent methyltransferase [Candidatus Paceibacterota bacterium]|nr:class I SAM-dependent methyltransferase [Candidatus Paceibacterota bacterium]
MKRSDVTTLGWDEYELLDSGEGRKLERFGDIVLDRPDTQALWKKEHSVLWERAQASFSWADKGERWFLQTEIPQTWTLPYTELQFILSLKQFKHVGLFPEHEPQWQEIAALCKAHPGLRVLNLFGYTGAASVVAAAAGATVTHVDASKQTIEIVKENLAASALPSDSIRLVCEDALRYAKRLVARGEQFEVIIMDPPAFGRGPKGEVWKIEEGLADVVALVPQLLSERAKLVLLNGYTAGYSARTFGELLHDVLPSGTVTFGDIGIAQKNSDRVLTTGMYGKWEK